MATVKLTKRAVDALSADTAPAYLFDTDVSGFGIRCTPNGVKTYILQYRVGHGGRRARKQRVTIGRHGSPWTVETARAEARRLLGQVAQGEDPAAEIDAARRAITIGELIDLYLAEGVAHKKPSTLATDRARFANHIRPVLGAKKVTDITRADVERLMADMIAGRVVCAPRAPGAKLVGPRSVPRGGRGAAAQVVTLIGTLLAFAVKRGLRTDNPAHGIDKPKVRRIERFLTSEEIGRLGTALTAEEKATGNPFPVAAIRLLLLTGARRSEILKLRWAWVDLERRALFLPDSKEGGRKTIHLNAPAVSVLDSLPQIDGNPFVFPGSRRGQALLGMDWVWARVRAAAELQDVRLHDLRHSAASIAAAAGVSLLLIGRVLGHRQASTTERYAHLTSDPIKAAAELIGTQVATTLGLPNREPAHSDQQRPDGANRLRQIGPDIEVSLEHAAAIDVLRRALYACGLTDQQQLSRCLNRICCLPDTLCLPRLVRTGRIHRPLPGAVDEVLGEIVGDTRDERARLLALEENKQPKKWTDLSRAERARANRSWRAFTDAHPSDISARKGRPAEFDGALALYILFVIAEATERSASDFTYATYDGLQRRPRPLLRALLVALALHHVIEHEAGAPANPHPPTLDAVVTRIVQPARSAVFHDEARRLQLSLTAAAVAAQPDLFRFLLREVMRQRVAERRCVCTD